MSEKRTFDAFTLVNRQATDIGKMAGKYIGTFSGRPSMAARKAMKKSIREFGTSFIVIRERGTDAILAYHGSMVEIPRPSGTPEWIKGDKIASTKVKRIREMSVIHIGREGVRTLRARMSA